MKKILLTGFEAFLDNASNPTALITKKLHKRTIGICQVHGEILPVSYNLVSNQLESLYKDIKPDACIHLGLNGRTDEINIEKVAINLMDGPEDNDHVEYSDQKILANGENAYFSTLPIEKMINILTKNDIPNKMSLSAGSYVCNSTMYHSLRLNKELKLNIPVGFIHVPPHKSLDQNGMDLEIIQYAIELCLHCL